MGSGSVVEAGSAENDKQTLLMSEKKCLLINSGISPLFPITIFLNSVEAAVITHLYHSFTVLPLKWSPYSQDFIS